MPAQSSNISPEGSPRGAPSKSRFVWWRHGGPRCSKDSNVIVSINSATQIRLHMPNHHLRFVTACVSSASPLSATCLYSLPYLFQPPNSTIPIPHAPSHIPISLPAVLSLPVSSLQEWLHSSLQVFKSQVSMAPKKVAAASSSGEERPGFDISSPQHTDPTPAWALTTPLKPKLQSLQILGDGFFHMANFHPPPNCTYAHYNII